MSKYIDVDKLIAEIDRYENTAIDAYNPQGEDADFWHGKVVACEDLKTFATSQQEQPQVADASKMEHQEVDLAEEITRFFSKNPIPNEHITDWPLLKNTAIHFYELGLKTRKEK